MLGNLYGIQRPVVILLNKCDIGEYYITIRHFYTNLGLSLVDARYNVPNNVLLFKTSTQSGMEHTLQAVFDELKRRERNFP